MFIGKYKYNIDSKCRIIIPLKFRNEIGDKMIVTKWFDGCLAVYTFSQWKKIYNNLQKLPITKREVRVYTHMIMSRASECLFDHLGRIRIPKYLLEEVKIKKKCIIVGVSDHLEIWDKNNWNKYYDKANKNFEKIAESLTEFF